jgi:hypothetical protein
MADLNNTFHTRRKFMALGLLAGAGIVTGDVVAQPAMESGEKEKMLTRDGRLVEVDKALLPPPSKKKHASKRDILRWIHPEE